MNEYFIFNRNCFYDLLEHLAIVQTSTLAINFKLRNFLNYAIGILNFEKKFLKFISDTLIWYLCSMLGLNLSCAMTFEPEFYIDLSKNINFKKC